MYVNDYVTAYRTETGFPVNTHSGRSVFVYRTHASADRLPERPTFNLDWDAEAETHGPHPVWEAREHLQAIVAAEEGRST